MKRIITLASFAIFTTTAFANEPDATLVINNQLEATPVSISTPGDLNSQRIRGAAAINAGCVTNETYDTTLDAEDVVDAIAAECQAEAPATDPVEEINEAEAVTQPTEDYPVKE